MPQKTSIVQYFELDPLGESEMDYCFANIGSAKLGFDSLALNKGTSVKEESPDGWPEPRVGLDEDTPGLIHPDFIGNTDGVLVSSKIMAELILSRNVGQIETIPFVLLNHRGHIHSRDYLFLNPLGTFDVMHMKKSEYRRYKNGTVSPIGIGLVLDKSKLESLPELFRLREDPQRYILAEPLVADLRKHKFSNLVLNELDVA